MSDRHTALLEAQVRGIESAILRALDGESVWKPQEAAELCRDAIEFRKAGHAGSAADALIRASNLLLTANFRMLS